MFDDSMVTVGSDDEREGSSTDPRGRQWDRERR